MAAIHCATCDKPYADRTGQDPCPRCGGVNPSVRAKASARLQAESKLVEIAAKSAADEQAAQVAEARRREAAAAADLDRRVRDERTRAEAKRELSKTAPAKALTPEEAALAVRCERCMAEILAGATVCPWCGHGRIVPLGLARIFGYTAMTSLIVGALAGGFFGAAPGVLVGTFCSALSLIWYGRESEEHQQRLGRLVRGRLEPP